ncbi:helix-turn-helix domain-containing protein [Macromonas nakdongensis]|jgi:excisionase family DNA binding protein|uniref:helix-turn-helix domain-containing protein n=1 Tax=Macromonas nakdongensis TaxID=1843082 RepID=UPI001E34EFA4|nr:helix-turn-helix domain-containing protein [Macromonas nakdongensis]
MNQAPAQNDMSSANYYTTLEVAKILGMAVRSVQLMVDRGDLQAWKTPGGHRRITRESLERWIQGSRAGVTGVAALHGTPSDLRQSGRRRPAVHVPRILLIEDSSHFQNLVSMLVKQRFPSVDLHIANDGITGLVSFGHLQPDLIIVDILLPGIDGATMITGLRRHALFGQCKLVVLTSLDQEQRAPYAFALQDVPVVHKPKLVQELPGLIESALQHLIAPAAAAPVPA